MTLLDAIEAKSVSERRIPVLETARLVLRAPRSDDAQAIATLVNDRRIAENTLRIPYPYAVEDAEAFLRVANTTADEIVFLITGRDGAVVGCCGIAKLEADQPEIGYWLGVPFWGRGFATEAARAVIDHGFSALGYDVLFGGARVSNPASRRVLEKCGFQWTGVGLYRIRALGSSAPIDRFRLDLRLWASLRSWGKASNST
jgi:RimJ/RimL family protein N-acetyltransferase